MKKIHGTYSIQPESISTSVIQDSAITRDKLDLSDSTIRQVFSKSMVTGNDTFSSSGKTIWLPEEWAGKNYIVTVTPVVTSPEDIDTGSVSVLKQNGWFTVFNTGSFRGRFDYIVMAV